MSSEDIILTMGALLTHCGIVPDAGVLGFDESFNSCITSSVSLLPIPLALSCSTCCHHQFCSVDGAGVGGGGDF